MTLREALQAMIGAGYTRIRDDHSRLPKDIRDAIDESQWDLNDYTLRMDTGEIVQNHDRPCNHFVCT